MRKRKTYAGDSALLPADCETDFSGKSACVISAQHDGFADFICGYGDCTRSGSGFPYGKSAGARGELACYPSSAFSRCFADRSDSDCERISQGPERGGIPAERCLSHYSDNSAGGGAVHGNHAAECVDPAGNKPDLCTAGMDSAEEGGRQIYV